MSLSLPFVARDTSGLLVKDCVFAELWTLIHGGEINPYVGAASAACSGPRALSIGYRAV